MGFGELLVLAVGVSMDAFAVSICKGLAMQKATPGGMAIVGGWFGGFQALMPLIGFYLGTLFASAIEAVDHWVAFGLLGVIGAGMLKEALEKSDECCCCADEHNADLGAKTMVVLAVATSIDALAVGVTFAFLKVDIIPAVAFIGIVTFTLSSLGTWVGGMFGARFKSKAEFAGGAILMLMGTRILLTHLGLIG